ncbi:hypothetical protein FRZ61_43010 [Hypericibacter adhaerens]|jgi:hypothetical protein|uniref:Uncharacterized protein n=1 Tax=Hypericibacter adhaerens TaxID=2602016 RepID=A0A5J6N6R7_9PROT|nr:hypothetical protein [Hypericibacter adhaerens]QEX24360.1 hypothetical protein FRZ61_43010 [Hypericibacter adhaerens]
MATPPKVVDSDNERYFSGKASDGTLVYVGPVTQEQLRDAKVSGKSTGYYLCEFDAEDPSSSLNILASFVSPEAAYRFAEVLGLFDMDRPISAFEEALNLSD